MSDRFRFRAWTDHMEHRNLFDYDYKPFKDDAPIMQCTGIKDKNGALIWEGDVIRGDLYDDRLPTMGVVVYDDAWGSWGSQNDAGVTPIGRIARIEIAGNIYDNPELWEVRK